MENQLISAFLLENNQVEVNYVSDDIRSVSYTFSRDGEVFRLKKISETGTNSIYKVIFQNDTPLELGHIYKLKTNDEEETILRLDRYVASKEFDDLYAYEGRIRNSPFLSRDEVFYIGLPLRSPYTRSSIRYAIHPLESSFDYVLSQPQVSRYAL